MYFEILQLKDILPLHAKEKRWPFNLFSEAQICSFLANKITTVIPKCKGCFSAGSTQSFKMEMCNAYTAIVDTKMQTNSSC